MKLLTMPAQTYNAKLIEVEWEGHNFKIAGTGTYPFSLQEVLGLADALDTVITDVKRSCLYERDTLLMG